MVITLRKMADQNTLDKLSAQFEEFYTNPEIFLDPSSSLHGELVSSSKLLYEFLKDFELNYTNKGSSLQELLIEGFDNEQIWQELQLQNNPCIRQLKHNINTLESSSPSLYSSADRENHCASINGDKINDNDNEEKEESGDTDDENEDMMGDLDEEGSDEEAIFCKKYKSTVVDDKFFQLREMEDFLDEQDRIEEQRRDDDGTMDYNEDGDVDFFKGDWSDEEETGTKSYLTFKDFFDNPTIKDTRSKISVTNFNNNKNVTEAPTESTSSHDISPEDKDDGLHMEEEITVKSKFQCKQEEMKLKIGRLEESNLTEKPWQLKGESRAKARPVNSLLEEHVSFDHASVGAPVITEETTETLEDLIRQRIKDQAWDDVQRKRKPTTQPFEYKKAPELNMEKSKQSLAEVYEKEYLKQAEKDKEEEESEEHLLVKRLMNKLFVQLDALSNFQFTPKPPKPELKIITNTPSLQMEEVTPITMTTASQLAPEEIYDKKKGDVKGDGEKTEEDRKRERRQKKLKKKFSIKEKEKKEKLKAQSGKITKSSKKTAVDMLKRGTRNTIVNEKNKIDKSVKSSSDFFSRLQDEAKKNITKQKSALKLKNTKKKRSAESLKL